MGWVVQFWDGDVLTVEGNAGRSGIEGCPGLGVFFARIRAGAKKPEDVAFAGPGRDLEGVS